MALMSERARGICPEDGVGTVSKGPGWPVRRVVIPAVGIAFGLWAMATVASIYAVGATPATSADTGPGRQLTAQRSVALIDSMRQVTWVSASLAPPAATKQHDRFWLLHDDCGVRCVPKHSAAKIATLPQPGMRRPAADRAALDARFSSVVEQAALTPDRLAALFGGSEVAPEIADDQASAEVRVASLEADLPVAGALDMLKDAPVARSPSAARFEQTLVEAVEAVETGGPDAARFAPILAERQRSFGLAMAYVETLPEGEEIVVASLDDGDGETLALGIPDTAPLPDRRPKWQPPREPERAERKRDDDNSGKDMLAYARPDAPAGGISRAFKDLFSAPNNPSAGTAIYDIAAATVYMPDGTRLEAHSGLGHMVDKPRYADQKNRGPTPPNTYKLVMRESRFHGVEAIRLLPVDGKNKYGRDGLLAHTYMLRGGLAQSNGCVVFKDYHRFLRAFKKGHIKRLVVVPGRSRPGQTQTARNGRDA